MGVDSIIDERPTYPSCVQGYTDTPVDGACDCRPAEECAPVKRQAYSVQDTVSSGASRGVRTRTEDGLWPIRDAFHEWVYGNEGEGRGAEEDTVKDTSRENDDASYAPTYLYVFSCNKMPSPTVNCPARKPSACRRVISPRASGRVRVLSRKHNRESKSRGVNSDDG